MNSIKKYFAAATLTAVLAFGSGVAFAGDGIIMAGIANPGGDPCVETSETASALTGIIMAGLTGIIMAGVAPGTTDCGIIMAG
jgi:hypothetical protein